MAKIVKLSVTSTKEAVFRKLKQSVLTKHENLRSYLSEELTKAMNVWIENKKEMLRVFSFDYFGL